MSSMGGYRKRHNSSKKTYVEDFLTEPLDSGAYKIRKAQAKNLEHEKLLTEAAEREKLESIRQKREEELKGKFQNIIKTMDMNRKIEWLLPYITESVAFEFLRILYEKEPQTCQQLMKYLIHPSDIHRLDEFIYRIQEIGHGPKNKIKLNYIIKILRKIKGVKPKIEVERNKERMELSEKLAKERNKDE